MKQTQHDRLIELMRRKPYVTTREIIFECGTNYPQSLLKNAIDKGYDIKSRKIEGKNYLEYWLVEQTELSR